MSSDDLRSMIQRGVTAMNQQGKASLSAMATLQMQLARANLGRAEQGASTESGPTVVGDQYLVFSLFDREFAVKADTVQGVDRLVELTPVPNVVPWVRGVINSRGSIISVVDLRMFLDLEQLPYTPRTRLLSMQYNEMVICFIVDGVSEMLPVPPAAIMSGNTRQAVIPQWVQPYTAGYALFVNRTLLLLDAPRLLFSDKIQHYQM